MKTLRVFGDKKYEIIFVILAWGRLKTDTKPKSYKNENVGKYDYINLKKYLPCRKDTQDKVEDKLGKVSYTPGMQSVHFLNKECLEINEKQNTT